VADEMAVKYGKSKDEILTQVLKSLSSPLTLFSASDTFRSPSPPNKAGLSVSPYVCPSTKFYNFSKILACRQRSISDT